MRKILKPVIEALAGIPSVVYGFFGLDSACAIYENHISVEQVSVCLPHH